MRAVIAYSTGGIIGAAIGVWLALHAPAHSEPLAQPVSQWRVGGTISVADAQGVKHTVGVIVAKSTYDTEAACEEWLAGPVAAEDLKDMTAAVTQQLGQPASIETKCAVVEDNSI